MVLLSHVWLLGYREDQLLWCQVRKKGGGLGEAVCLYLSVFLFVCLIYFFILLTLPSAGERYCKQHKPSTCSKGGSVEPCCFLWYEYNLKKASCFTPEVQFQELAICTNM